VIFCRKSAVKTQNKNPLKPTAIRRQSEAATAVPKQLSSAKRQARMLNGIVKAAAIVGIAVIADRVFTDGTYADAALSMLRIEHSFQ
jgi:hypothetical protein